MNTFIFFRDSDDEAEGKNKVVEIVNEVEQEATSHLRVESAENKAAEALEKVFTQNDQEEMDTGSDK